MSVPRLLPDPLPPFVVTDVNADGTIGGADFGAILSEGMVRYDPSAVPFRAGSHTALGAYIAKEAVDKTVIMLGETHYMNASAVLLETVKALAPSGKPITICAEYEPETCATSFAMLNAATPESLSDPTVQDVICDAYLQDVCNWQNKQTGGSFTLADAKRMAEKNPQVAADLADFKNLIQCRALGARIVAVDMNNRTDTSAHSDAREAVLSKNIQNEVDETGITICLLGSLHCAKAANPYTERTSTVGMMLDDQYCPESVLHVNLVPEVMDAVQMRYSLDSALNLPPKAMRSTETPLAGIYKTTDFDSFLYHDAR
jgi:hypothetical protein